ncbi:hypothetical protein [Microvirga arabica]|uniref:hypothetical protein n=1 Tax=Microvirga arabica TaxID=1128671 RepID=UPI00193ADC9E|nr:hypothetical protein [Microvirga arabica]MBM1172208.1 hypothetical protein [Microvirga arabica]
MNKGRAVPKGRNDTLARAHGLLAGALVFLLLGSSVRAQSSASSPGPFAGFAGSWTGSGTIALSNGTTERLRCQAAYAVASAGNNLRQNLRCGSDSYTFELRTDINYDGGRVGGSWAETTRNLSGRISGRVNTGRIDAVAEGPGFSAGIAMSTRGSRQTVSIRSQGTELSQVSVDLSRTR